jgi:sulfur relay (sulfurtransferase) complex TusBCD TusD component (DsrE family)
MIGLFVATPPGSRKTEAALEIAEKAVLSGQKVLIFFYRPGVMNLRDERYVKLLDRGATIYACSQSCQAQGITAIPDNIVLGELGLLSNLMSGCQKFVAFIR